MDENTHYRIIVKCVDDIFLPASMPFVYEFLEDFKKKVIYEHEYKKAFGFTLVQDRAILNLSVPALALPKALSQVLKQNA